MLELKKNSVAYFISDLHLSNSTAKTLEAFENWLANVAKPDVLVFILGDLFDMWVGDDYSDKTVLRVEHALTSAANTGCKLHLMHGNRDFLIGDDFCCKTGCELLPDPEFLNVNQHIILLTHGDQLCSDDINYQRFRTMTRSEKWQNEFLSQPLSDRLAYAADVRNQSDTEKKSKTMSIMDVNQDAVSQAFAGRWPDNTILGKSDVILHGHTHRCAIHGPKQPGRINKTHQAALSKNQRIVLPDWQFDETKRATKGGFLMLEPNGHLTMSLFSS